MAWEIGAFEYVTGGGDITSPTLSTPTGTPTGQTTASGAVTTNEANGTLYAIVTTNTAESVATVKAGGSQPVTALGSQAVSFTGLTAATTYYTHYVHTDAAGNDSTVASSASFVTATLFSPAWAKKTNTLIGAM